jgi:hypothetical protein
VAVADARPVLIRWRDSHVESGWAPVDEALRKIEDADYLAAVSVGLLVHEDEDKVVICMSIGNTGEEVCDLQTIPREAITFGPTPLGDSIRLLEAA